MKYALVTGGSRGIGAAICKELARNGYPVIINYVSREDAAMEVKREIEAEGGKAELLKFDVADHKAADQVIDGWISSHPDDYIAVLVNNAGIRRDGLMMWMEDSDWYDVINIHLNGFFHVTRKTDKLFCSQGRHYSSNKGSGPGGGKAQGYRQCCSSGLCRNRYDQGTRPEYVA